MTIILTQAVRIAGTTQPIGTQLTLEGGAEGDLVHRGCATYVTDPHSGEGDTTVRATTNPLTGGISLSAAGVTCGAPSVNGRKYTSINLLLNQSGAVEVLPTDYSDNDTVCSFGANSTVPWTNSGYYTSEAAVDASLRIPNAAVNLNLYSDSFICAVTVKDPTVSQGLMGTIGASSASNPYFNVQIDGSGNVGFRVRVNASSPFAGTFTTSAITGGADHRVLMAWDAPTKKLYSYVDGAATNLSPQTAATVLSTDIITDVFALGKVLTANTYAAKFAGFQMLKFYSSGLPSNFVELVALDNSRRRSGLLDCPVFF